MEENLKLVETFFKYNLAIKSILHECAPKDEDRYNTEYIIKYSDKLYKALVDIQFYIQRIFIQCGYSTKEINDLKLLFEKYHTSLENCENDFDKLKKFYVDSFSNMDINFVNMVANKCVGYTLNYGVNLESVKSINELLHLLHSSLINNEKNYKQMPKLKSKKNFEGYDITLYGKESVIADNLFEQFRSDISCGDADILSLNNKILMMIRDRGHALSIEISINNAKCFVQYFIPKICNIKMVNELKGVNKVNNKSHYTVGMFETETQNITSELIALIEGVPMDDHMFIEGELLYADKNEEKTK